MTDTPTTAVRLPREVAGLAGVSWAYLVALTRGARGVEEAASILPALRAQYVDFRPEVVDALVTLGYSRSGAEAGAPNPRPGATFGADDVMAIVTSLWPFLELARLDGASEWGDAAQLEELFSTVPADDVSALRDWFVDSVASVWPQGTGNRRAQHLWWFASNIRSGADANRVFNGYITQGVDEVEGPAVAVSSTQDAVAALAAREAEPGAEFHISARPSNLRSAWVYLLWAVGFLSLGAGSYGLWWYQRKHGRMPWETSRR